MTAPQRSPLGARLRPVLVALAAAALLLAGCSSSGGDTAGGDATIAVGSPSPAPDGSPSCEDVEPGVVVDRSLATVAFDTESVCPGWVTVEQGTAVTFTNAGASAHTVVVTATQLPGSTEVARFTLAPGATQPLDTRDVALMGFSTDALPGFRGTVEVVAPGGAMAH